MIKLKLRDDIVITPEVEKWISDVEKKLNDYAYKQLENLMIFGTTHPELDLLDK